MSLHSEDGETVESQFDVNKRHDLSDRFGQLAITSGNERRIRLDDLQEVIKERSNEKDYTGLLECLKASAGDIQRIALNFIIQCDSVTSLPIPEIVSNLVLIFNRLPNTAHPSLSACRTCALAFRVLRRILLDAKSSDISNIDVSYFVTISTKWLQRGLNDILQNRPSRNTTTTRTGPGNALAFQNRNRQPTAGRGFNSHSTSTSTYIPTSRLHKQSSSSSLKSVAPSIASAGWESESGMSASERDIDEDSEKQLASTCRSVRSHVIHFLEVLNAKMAKSLLLHWPRILSEGGNDYICLMDIVEIDPMMSNRIVACRTVESYLLAGSSLGFFNGAEERTGLSAYTSLSSRIASIIVQIRSRLLKVLQTNCTVTVKEAVIRCTVTLVETTGKAKLRQSHADSIRPTALQLCSSTNANVAVKAHSLLSTLLSTGKVQPSSDDRVIGENLLTTLKSEDNTPKLKAQAWAALMTMVDTQTNYFPSDNLRSLSLDHLHSDSDELRQAVGLYILAIVKMDGERASWEPHMQQMKKDQCPPIRAIAADCLSLLDPEGDGLNALCKDEESSVRAAAVRAIGVATQIEKREIHKSLIRAGLKDSSALVRQRASWSLGNLCEVTGDSQLLSDCLLARNDDERIVVHTIRGIGALLERIGLKSLQEQSRLIVEAIQWTQDILLTSKDPKIRWNVCACIGRMFTNGNPDVVGWLMDLILQSANELPLNLANVVCHDKMFKTRLSASTALTLLLKQNKSVTKIPADSVNALRQIINEAKNCLSLQRDQAPFKELQLHVIPLQNSIESLSALLDEFRT